LRGIATAPDQAEPSSSTDEDIRRNAIIELQKQNWGAGVKPIVNNGVVHLWGIIARETERSALRVAMENIPGVRGTEDHLSNLSVFAAA
jgi:hypothetical protein